MSLSSWALTVLRRPLLSLPYLMSQPSVNTWYKRKILSDQAEWRRHPEHMVCSRDSACQRRDTVRTSWVAGIIYRSAKNGGSLRTAELGALHAIAAHWSVSQKNGVL